MNPQEDEGYVLGDLVPITDGAVYEELRRLYGDEMPRPIQSATITHCDRTADDEETQR